MGQIQMNRTTKNNSLQIKPETATVFQICKLTVITYNYANFSFHELLLIPASEVVLNGIARKSERLLALFSLRRISFPVWRTSLFLFLFFSSLFLFLFLSISLHQYLYVYLSLSLYLRLSISVSISISTFSLCISISLYLFIYLYLYTCLYIYISISPLSFSPFD